MQHETLRVFAKQAVKFLLITCGPQNQGGHGLSLTTCEHGRTVDAWQN